MKLIYELGITSVILRVFISDTGSATGAGKTGLSHLSSGLIVATIADVEASATVYTAAAGNIEGITTLGTFAAPSTNKCRFKEVDATNLPGVYELQIADARWAVSGARSAIVNVFGASGAAAVLSEVQLRGVPINLAQVNITETSGSTVGGQLRLAPALLGAKKVVSNQTTGVITVYAEDGTTVLATITPTSNGDGTEVTRTAT